VLGYVIAGEGWKTRAQLACCAVDGRDEDQEEHGMPKLLQNEIEPWSYEFQEDVVGRGILMINFRAMQVLYEFERGRQSRQNEVRSN